MGVFESNLPDQKLLDLTETCQNDGIYIKIVKKLLYFEFQNLTATYKRGHIFVKHAIFICFGGLFLRILGINMKCGKKNTLKGYTCCIGAKWGLWCVSCIKQLKVIYTCTCTFVYLQIETANICVGSQILKSQCFCTEWCFWHWCTKMICKMDHVLCFIILSLFNLWSINHFISKGRVIF